MDFVKIGPQVLGLVLLDQLVLDQPVGQLLLEDRLVSDRPVGQLLLVDQPVAVLAALVPAVVQVVLL